MDDEVARHATGRIEQVDRLTIGGWLTYNPEDPEGYHYLSPDTYTGTHATRPSFVPEGCKCVRVSIEFRL